MSFLPFAMDYLTDDMVKKAEEELGETPEMRKEALIKLRKLVKDDSKLAGVPTDDHYLLLFLRARKFNVKRALSLLHNYYHVKKTNAEIYRYDFDGILKNISDEILNFLPYRDEDGCVICIVKLCNWNVHELKFSSILHAITCLVIACVDLYPATQICGFKFIFDTKGLGLKHARYISTKEIHLVAKGMTNSLHARFKGFHIYNESPWIKFVWNILDFFLTEKIKNRVHFHSSSLESIHEHINPALLPEEYGGTLTCTNSSWFRTVQSWEKRYYELMSIGMKPSKNTNQD